MRKRLKWIFWFIGVHHILLLSVFSYIAIWKPSEREVTWEMTIGLLDLPVLRSLSLAQEFTGSSFDGIGLQAYYPYRYLIWGTVQWATIALLIYAIVHLIRTKTNRTEQKSSASDGTD